jgi:hypothetical protein
MNAWQTPGNDLDQGAPRVYRGGTAAVRPENQVIQHTKKHRSV